LQVELHCACVCVPVRSYMHVNVLVSQRWGPWQSALVMGTGVPESG
jgi:hypothetical protein